MRQATPQLEESDLSVRITEIAVILSQEGRTFNEHLVEQFKEWDRANIEELPDLGVLPAEHLIFYKAIAQILGWLQQLPAREAGEPFRVPATYLRMLLEARRGLVKDTGQRLEELLAEGEEGAKFRRPRRLLAVIAGLETWSKVQLPNVSPNGVLNLEELQRLALSVCGRARWTALAPLKMYSIYKLSEGVFFPIPREIFPPMGSAVSRGIERLFGFALGESENDYVISRGLHLKLADLAQTTIWEINSGLYRLGGGV
jgi:hypothetical protein